MITKESIKLIPKNYQAVCFGQNEDIVFGRDGRQNKIDMVSISQRQVLVQFTPFGKLQSFHSLGTGRIGTLEDNQVCIWDTGAGYCQMIIKNKVESKIGMCRFDGIHREFLCQMDTVGTTWKSIGVVQQFLNGDQQQMIKMIQESLDSRLLRPWGKFKNNIFHAVALQPKVLVALLEKIDDSEELQKYLLFFENSENKSPLDLAVQNNQLISVQILVNALTKYCNNPLFNNMMDENLIQLLKYKVDLDDYFSSDMAFYEITWETYPGLHYDNSYIVKAFNRDSLRNLVHAYDDIFGQDLREPSEQDVLYPISYYVVNLPQTLTNNPKELIQILNECEIISIFEKKMIQTIIDFKWETYTKDFFLKQFYIFLLFSFTFLLDLMIIGIQDDQLQVASLAFKSICSLILLYFLSYEFQQARNEGYINYLKSVWNYIDLLLTFSYVTISAMQLLYNKGNRAGDEIQVFTQIIYSLIVILIFVKFCFFMRIFPGFGFLVSMLKEVIVDLKYFLAFFFIVLFVFGLIFKILQQDIQTYEGIGEIGYFFLSFRTALGDFELDSFKDTSHKVILWAMWIYWAAAVFISSIIFLNFIIAVISESYEKVMQKAIVKTFQEKVSMILERENQFTEDDFQNPNYFPRYLVVRMPVEGGQEVEEWQGFVKDIKNNIYSNIQSLKQNLNLSSKRQRSAISELDVKISNEMKATNENEIVITTKIETLEAQMKAMESELKKEMEMNAETSKQQMKKLEDSMTAQGLQMKLSKKKMAKQMEKLFKKFELDFSQSEDEKIEVVEKEVEVTAEDEKKDVEDAEKDEQVTDIQGDEEAKDGVSETNSQKPIRRKTRKTKQE